MPLRPDEIALFERSRARLAAIAYRMLGSASDAEDVVQDTFLRWQAADRDRIGTPEAWLTKVLTNLCLNQLTSARSRRETYVGAWLPEPVLAGDPMLGPVDTVEQRESVSLAMLTLMERLRANERAVYVLREAFEYSHREIAEILEISEANCQQIYRRAKQHLSGDRPRVAVDPGTVRRTIEEFLAAAASGEVERLVTLLTDGATSTADGGGKVPARHTPVVGALAVARLVRSLFQPSKAEKLLAGSELRLYLDAANGVPALMMVVDGRVAGVMWLDVDEEGIAAVRVQANPDKLLRANRQWRTAAHEAPLPYTW